MAYDYDVAISFLRDDEPLALQIREALAPLRVFLYSKAQEELAGREGVEAFREVFRDRARLAVVLFRSGWGRTPWTGVEEVAIRDHCLGAGWDHQMFVKLDKTEKPKWVPDSGIYFDFQSFGLSDLIGAIKGTCARLGVELRPPSVADRARQIAAEEESRRETEQALRTSAQPLYDACASLFAAVELRLVDIEKSTGWTILRDADVKEFVAFLEPLSLQLLGRWLQATLPPGASLVCRLLAGRLPTPKERRMGYRVYVEPEERSTTELKLTQAPEFGWCWEYQGRRLSAEAAADLVVDKLVSARQREQAR